MHQTLAFFNGQNSEGNFTFNGQYTGNGFADFLLGYPYSVTRDYYRQLYGSVGNFWSLFVQDNYRLTANLTINAGLRWEQNPFYTGVRGQKAGFDVTNGKVIIPSNFDVTAQPLSSQLLQQFSDRIETTSSVNLPETIQPTSRGFAPRLGFAWRPFGSNTWAVRGAYGIFDVFPDDNLINNTIGTVPFIASSTVINDAAGTYPPSRTFGNFFLGQPVTSANTAKAVCSFGYVADSCSTPNVYGGEPNVKDTYVQQWNFGVQKQISATQSWDVSYVANKSTHLNQSLSINDPAPGPGAIQNRRPYPQWGTITYPVFDENGNYEALQSKYQIRAWRDLNLLAAYAHQKCIDYGSGEGGTTVLLLHSYRAVCDYDQTNVFSGSFSYLLPFGAGQKTWWAQGIKGWRIAGIATIRSGLPYTPVWGTDVANTGVSNQRPKLVAPPQTVGNVACWYYVAANPSCVALDPGGVTAFVSPAQYTYGNSGRNILRAQALQQWNLSIQRIFSFGEVRRLEFRGELFNAFNHPTFSAPNATVNSSSGGQITSTVNAARVIQLALKLYF
jgi:hypothetical protein